MKIRSSHLRNGTGLQPQWEAEFNSLITDMNGGLNYICSDEKLVKEYYEKFNALYEKYKALAERYNFYRYFMLQKNTTSPGWDTSDYDINHTFKAGFITYDKSKIVQEDLKKGGTYSFHRATKWNGSPKEVEFSATLSSNERVFYLETGHRESNYSTGRDLQGKTILRNSFHWRYTGAWLRRYEVFLKVKTIKLSPELYPFVGID